VEAGPGVFKAIQGSARFAFRAAASSAPKLFVTTGTLPILNVLQDTCFAAGTPILTPNGSKPIEELMVGDLVLARPENRVDGPVRASVVEEVFEIAAPTIRLVVNGRTIRTTAQHPFYVVTKGWTPASNLKVGDKLVGAGDETATVEHLEANSQSELVYNLRVAVEHTYFVGCDEWAFSVWVHNTYSIVQIADDIFELRHTTQAAKTLSKNELHTLCKSNGVIFYTADAIGSAKRLSNSLNQKVGDFTGELLLTGEVARANLRSALGPAKGATDEAHHLLPWAMRDLEIVEAAARAGFNLNGKVNGVRLSYLRHRSINEYSHPEYNKAIRKRLTELWGNTGMTDAQAAQTLAAYTSRLKAAFGKTTSLLH
jgi:hypothetical protein